MREGVSPAAGASGPAESAAPTNGSHEAPASFAPASFAPPASQPPADPRHASSEPTPIREYHSEPRENAVAHEAAPLAHFEPTPKPSAGAAQDKPYVVWSSAPTKDVSGQGPEE
jgi:hypothetical protein